MAATITKIETSSTSVNGDRRHIETKKDAPTSGLAESALRCVHQAAGYAYETMKPDGHWYTELRANICFTAEYICLRTIIGPPLTEQEKHDFSRWIISQQNTDGSWGLAPTWPGDVSTSTMAYFSLKLMGLDSDLSKHMGQCRRFILSCGGMCKVGVTAQIALALFGLIKWDEMAQVPAELMLMPESFPLNLFAFSYWSRVTAVAIMVLRHHKPVFALPGNAAADEFLEELYVNPADKRLRFTPPIAELYNTGQMGRFFASVADKSAATLLEPWLKKSYLREISLAQCVRFIIEHTEPVAGYGSFWNSNFTGTLALICSGFSTQHPVVRCISDAIEASIWRDADGARMQVTVGPVWDTAVMAMGLLECGLADNRLDETVQWLKLRQITQTHGDYRIRNKRLTPGGWPFQYRNSYYPDNDDTLVSILTIVMRSPKELHNESGAVAKGVEWLLGMQCSDDGWGCFDIDNNSRFLNLFPFGQGNEFFDETVPDITGRVIECFGYILNRPEIDVLHPSLRQRMRESCIRGLRYLRRSQDPTTGGWKSRWHVNYLNGTPSVLSGLAYFKDDLNSLLDDEFASKCMIAKPLQWLKTLQNPDGGWGESLHSYGDHDLVGRGRSTPTQTSWVILGLLSHLSPKDQAIERGIEYLVRTQVSPTGKGMVEVDHNTSKATENGNHSDKKRLTNSGLHATWDQEDYVSVGFPNILWLDYASCRHGYPMMALGRYLHALKTRTVV